MGKRKRYGVMGMMEWQVVIPAGKAKFAFHFTGGTLTAYGVTPAVYETDNELFQQVIENSGYFKRGKIVALVNYEEEAEEAAALLESLTQARPVFVPTAAAGGSIGSGAEAIAEAAAGSQILAGSQAKQDGAGLEVVKMATVKDARQFLIDGYGVEASKLLRKEDVVKSGRTKGVEFVFEK